MGRAQWKLPLPAPKHCKRNGCLPIDDIVVVSDYPRYTLTTAFVQIYGDGHQNPGTLLAVNCYGNISWKFTTSLKKYAIKHLQSYSQDVAAVLLVSGAKENSLVALKLDGSAAWTVDFSGGSVSSPPPTSCIYNS